MGFRVMLYRLGMLGLYVERLRVEVESVELSRDWDMV